MRKRDRGAGPPAIIDGGMAASGLLAWVAVSKYTDHLPVYRIEQIGARQGVPLARSTLAEWIGKIGVALQPLSDQLAELLRQRPCLHADETPVRQLDPGQGITQCVKNITKLNYNTLEVHMPD